MRPHMAHTVIMGFGAQGSAQAQNLRDGGAQISVNLRPDSPRIREAEEAGLSVITDAAEAARSADTAVVLLPDSEQPAFYREVLGPNLRAGTAMVFAHGFSIHYGRITPRSDLDVLLAAPLAHGDTLRRDYVERGAVPCVTAVAQDATGQASERIREYAARICGRGPFIESSFSEEVETDLFAEQAVLCGGMPELVRAAFDTLAAAGYDERIAYVSCLRELRAIVELMWRDAIAGMRSRISDTARYGAITRGPRIINDSVRQELARILDEIRSGAFAKELAREQEEGFPRLKEMVDADEGHPIEGIHRSFGADGGAGRGQR